MNNVLPKVDRNYGYAKSAAELGEWIAEAADIGYWAEYRFTEDGIVIEGNEIEVHGGLGGSDRFPVSITFDQIAEEHIDRLWKRGGIKGVHPANYGWLNDPEDFDAATGDWVVQHIVYGEVIFG